MEKKLHRKSITHEDLTAAATTQSITVLDTPVDVMIEKCFVRLEEDFAGGSLSTFTIQVGDSADTDRLILENSVFTGQAPRLIGQELTELGDALGNMANYYNFSTRTHKILFTGSHNVNTATSGSLDVYIWYYVVPV